MSRFRKAARRACVSRIALCGFGIALVVGWAWASDHLDSPLTHFDPTIDIGDTFAFSGNNGFVLSMSFNPLSDAEKSGTMKLDPRALYEFKIDTDGDFIADLAYKLSVAADGAGQVQTLTLRRATGADAQSNEAVGEVVIEGRSSAVGEIHVNGGGGIKLFVGPRQDPFFFNFKGVESRTATALRYALSADKLPTDGTSANTFGPTNVTLLVLEVPDLPQTFIIWGTSSRSGLQLDRAGLSSNTAIFLPECYSAIPWQCHDFSAQKQRPKRPSIRTDAGSSKMGST